MNINSILLSISVLASLIGCNSAKTTSTVVKSTSKIASLEKQSAQFIYDTAPFPECHASSIVELNDGSLMATWFGGMHEKNPDVTIWVAVFKNGKWGPLSEVADGIQTAELRYPCWNPVLFNHSSGKLFLFYKVGPNPREWWGMMKYSTDNGDSWSDSEKIPSSYLGPIRAKPVELVDGNLLCPSSEEFTSGPWKTHMEIYNPIENTWSKTLVDHDSEFDVIQPTVLRYSSQKLQILCRSRQNKIIQSWSEDNGKSWSKLSGTELPNPSAGIDAVTLDDGRQLLIYNPTIDGPNDRAKLSIAASMDGISWEEIYKLEEEQSGEFSYPAMIISEDGNLQVTYTWNRKKVKHVVLEIK